MAKPWEEVVKDPVYVSLPEEEKSKVRSRYWNDVVLKDPETQKLNADGIAHLEQRFFGIPQEKTVLGKLKDFFYTNPAQGAETIRNFVASGIAPTEQEIVDQATRTGEVPKMKILANLATRGVTELVPMTPTEIALTVFGTKAVSSGAPKVAEMMSKSFPRFWSVMQRKVGKGLLAKLPEMPISPKEIPVEPVAPAATQAIATAPPAAPTVEDIFGQQLSKFNVSDDARGIFKETSELFKGQIDESRRGVIDWDETAKLADNLGMSVDSLVKRNAGQAFNAEQLEAAKGLVGRSLMEVNATRAAYLANPTDEALVQLNRTIARHAAVQESFLGARAEAGRALQILRKTTDAASGNLEKAIEILGGREITADIAKKLAAIDPNDIVAMNSFIRNVMKAKTSDQLYFVWINSILSSPWTHMRNLIGNSSMAVGKPVEKVARGGIDAVAGLFTGKRTAYMAEALPEAYGLARGMSDGLRKALYTFTTGIRPSVSKVEQIRINPIPGSAGRAIGVPVNILEATDEFYKAIISQSELSATAYRTAKRAGLSGKALIDRVAELEANPTPEMLEAATKESLVRTFQNRPNEALAGVARSIQRIPYIGRYIMPFVNTPVNILSQGAMRSPLGWLQVAKSIAQRKGQEQIVEEASKAAVGSVIAAGVAYQALQGKITGSPPKDAAERDRWYRSGKRPYSIDVGDYWMPYTVAEPWAANIGMIADAVQNAVNEGKKIDPSIASAVLTTFPRYFVSKTFMSGIRDFMDALSDGERFGPKLMMRQAGGLVPFSGFMRYIQSTYDQSMKDPQTVGQAMKTVVPGLASSVPKRLDVYGNVMKYPGFDDSVLQGVAGMMAVPLSKKVEDPLVSEDVEIDRSTGYPSSRIADVPLKDEEFRQVLVRSRQRYQAARLRLVKSPEWRAMPAGERNNILNKIKTASDWEAKATVYMKVLDRLPMGKDRMDFEMYGIRHYGLPPELLLKRRPKKTD